MSKKKFDQLETQALRLAKLGAPSSCDVTYMWNDASNFKIGNSSILGENVALTIDCNGVINGTFSGTFLGVSGSCCVGGSDKDVQFNDGGEPGGDSSFTWDGSTLTVPEIDLDGVTRTTWPAETPPVGTNNAVQTKDGTGFAGDSGFTYDGTDVTVGTGKDLKVTDLGANEIIYSSDGDGTIAGSADLTFDGSTLSCSLFTTPSITLDTVTRTTWPADESSVGAVDDIQTSDGNGGFDGDSGFTYDGTDVTVGAGKDLKTPSITLNTVTRTTWPDETPPGGSNNDVQTKDGTGFAGDSGFTYDGASVFVGDVTDAHLEITPGTSTVAIKGEGDTGDDCSVSLSVTDTGVTSQRMIIDKKGNVGIGTAADTTVLPTGSAAGEDADVTFTVACPAGGGAMVRIGNNEINGGTDGTQARLELCEDLDTDIVMERGFALHMDGGASGDYGDGVLRVARRDNARTDTNVMSVGRNAVENSLNIHGNSGMFVGVGTSTQAGTETFGVSGDVLVDGDVTADNINKNFVTLGQDTNSATDIDSDMVLFDTNYNGHSGGTWETLALEGITWDNTTGIFTFAKGGLYLINVSLKVKITAYGTCNFGNSILSCSVDNDGTGGFIAQPGMESPFYLSEHYPLGSYANIELEGCVNPEDGGKFYIYFNYNREDYDPTGSGFCNTPLSTYMISEGTSISVVRVGD